jgi:ubiquitin
MNCKSCGNDHPESFCPACGEKKFDTHQLSFKHFLEETFEGLIHFDNKFLHTIKRLITKPGQLSIDYTEGRRVKYMKPVQFFLVVNLLFFFLIIGNNIYSLPLYNYVSFKPFTDYNTVQIVKEKLNKTKLSVAEYGQVFNEKIKADSKEFILVFVPFYGLIFALLFFWKKKYFVEHLVFATHFVAFVLLVNLFAFYFIEMPFFLIKKIGYFQVNDYSPIFNKIYGIIISIIVAAYIAVAINKFYKPKIGHSSLVHTANVIWLLLISICIGYTFFIFIQGYRMLLFFKILYLN